LCYLGTCLLFPTGYLPLFVVGALLHDFEPEMAAWGSHLSAKGRYWLPLALFMGGLYLCSIQASAPGTYMPWHFFLPRFHGDNERYWHSIGAVMIMGGLLHSDGLQKIFGSKPARFLGDISFTLYLIHIPILCSLTSWLILWLQGYGRVGGAAITAFVTVAVVIGVSAALSRYVDGGAIRISRAAGRWWMTLPFVDKSNAVDGLLAER
jgi:peptidoglycan/LPS O-acetylase OafA/YrhL